ncbi:dephospho-CoA kinase [Flavobacterium sp. 3HN19-14]|uniref:dephospho-CoA kinase n=1 Tax=Flavobacterium sp. 3HN19-14 TaxID=3448133 RepID=UPI003EE39DD1
MAKIIGLTGGIGSGKTTVAQLFEALGVPVYIADAAAKEVSETAEAIAQIRENFGEEIIEDNRINRSLLANIVFNDPGKLQQLNRIIHPLVKIHFGEWLENFKKLPFVIREAAILFESGSYLDCDKIITVTAPLEIRIERVMHRDNTSRESILKRIENQWSDEMKIAKSDFVIENISPKILSYR